MILLTRTSPRAPEIKGKNTRPWYTDEQTVLRVCCLVFDFALGSGVSHHRQPQACSGFTASRARPRQRRAHAPPSARAHSSWNPALSGSLNPASCARTTPYRQYQTATCPSSSTDLPHPSGTVVSTGPVKPSTVSRTGFARTRLARPCTASTMVSLAKAHAGSGTATTRSSS